MATWRKLTVYAAVTIIVVFLIVSHQIFIQFPIFSTEIKSSQSIRLSMNESNAFQIPMLVHQMWKTGLSSSKGPPSETLRWRDGCRKINSDYTYKMYSDADLKEFVEINYPQYLQLFNSLKGVCKSPSFLN